VANEIQMSGTGGITESSVTARTGPRGAAGLTGREQRHLLASSQPYHYLSEGIACLSGIEDISADSGPAVTTLAVPAGRCDVTVHLIDWARRTRRQRPPRQGRIHRAPGLRHPHLPVYRRQALPD
jgi:hypothetical protein